MGENTSLHLPMCLISLEAGQTIPSVPRLFAHFSGSPHHKQALKAMITPECRQGNPELPSRWFLTGS